MAVKPTFPRRVIIVATVARPEQASVRTDAAHQERRRWAVE